MRQVVVRSVGVGCVVDDNGRSLRVIGNMPIKDGDTIWTDGRIVYGHRPTRPNVKPMIEAKGTPVLSSKLNGYIEEDGRYKSKDWGVENRTDNYFINNERIIFENAGTNYTDMIVLDAEVSEVSNEYFFASRSKKRNQICIYDLQIEHGTITGLSSVSNSFYVYIVKAIKDLNSGHFSTRVIQRLDWRYLLDTVFINEFASRYIRCNLSKVSTQVLDFRFVDKKGNWEIIACCCAEGYGVVDSGVADASIGTLETTYARDEQLIEVRPFSGDTVLCRWFVTQTANTTYVAPSSSPQSNKDRVTIKNAFFVARVCSDGKTEILQKKYEQPDVSHVYFSGYHINSWQASPMGGAWIFVPVWPLYGAPTGSFSYTVNAVYPKDEVNTDHAPDIGDAAGTCVLASWDVTCSAIELETSSYTVPGENTEQLDNFQVKLNEGYVAETDGFNLYNITDGKNTIADEIPSVNYSYRVEPYNNASQKRFFCDGHSELSTEKDDFCGFYCMSNQNGVSTDDPPKYHMIPHVCVGELKHGYLLSASGDKYHKGNLYITSENGGLNKMDEESLNMRLNKVKRVRRLKK